MRISRFLAQVSWQGAVCKRDWQLINKVHSRQNIGIDSKLLWILLTSNKGIVVMKVFGKTDIVFKRTGKANPNGSIPGTLTIGTKSWPTIERGTGHTFVRKGKYELLMRTKTRGRPVKCLCFWEDSSISSHLIHDAQDDDHRQLEGCIAPGLSFDDKGIKDSKKAMDEIFRALGNYVLWGKKTITVENNIWGSETKEQWIKRRSGK